LHHARIAEADHRELDGREVAKRADRGHTRLEVVDLGNRERHVVDAQTGRALADVNEAIGVAIDQRPQQHLAHDAEDRGVGADAKGEGDDDGGGQPLRAQQRSEADAHVLSEPDTRIEPAAVPDAPHRVADGGHVAKFAQRRQTRGLGMLAALDALLDAERQVAANLVVQLVVVRSHGLTRFLLPTDS
jgi:hypothetical protein